MRTEIRTLFVELERGATDRSRLEVALGALDGFQLTSWRPEQSEGRLDVGARNADVLILREGGQDGERMLGMVSGLRERHPSLVIVAAVPTPDCTTTVALLDAGVDEIVDTTGDIALATARIMAAARRRLRLTMPMLSEVGNLKFDRTNHRVWNADRQLRLSPLEYAFLDCLISAHGKSVGTRTLSDFVWTSNGRSPRSKNAVQVYVGYLRRKLSIAQVSIQNVRGKGYRLVAESAPSTRSAS